MSKKHKKFCITLNYIEHHLILTLRTTRWISISNFVSLIGISIGITSSALELKIFVIAAGIKKFKSMIKREKKAWYNSIVSKLKIKRNRSLNFQVIIDLSTCHDEYVLINNVLKEYGNMKKWKKKK